MASRPGANGNRRRRPLRRWLAVTSAVIATCVLVGPGPVLIDLALFWRHERFVLLRHASKDQLAPSGVAGRILFLGDSIFEGFPLRALVPQGFVTLNRGVSGDSIGRITRRYHDEVGVTEHDVVVVEGGINDILHGGSSPAEDIALVGRIARSYAAIIDDARRHSREPIVVSMLPVTGRTLPGYSGTIRLPTHLDLARVNAHVRAANSRLRSPCNERRIPFVDAHAALFDSRGELRRSFAMADRIHINCSGYEAITEMITPDLVRLLRSRPGGNRPTSGRILPASGRGLLNLMR